MIKVGMGALIRGGTFTVTGKSEKEGFWCLCMETKMIRGRPIISIEIPESDVLEGIEAHRTEEAARACAREESISKDIFKTRFLRKKMDADDLNTRKTKKYSNMS